MSMEIPATSLNLNRETVELARAKEIAELREKIAKGMIPEDKVREVKQRLVQLEADQESPL